MTKPFDNGSQFGDWRIHNCKRCKKQWNDGYYCRIEQALDLAYIENGHISQDIADRMGLPNDNYVWDCPEKEEA